MGKPSITNPTSSPLLRVFRAALVIVLLFAFMVGRLVSQTTSATVVPLLLPDGIVYDSSGTLYLAQATGHRILAVSPSGALTAFAGSGTQGFSGDGGPALAARLDTPTALAISPAGDLYVADSHNHRIRRIVLATGIITTVAGTGQPGRSPDGTLAAAAQIDLPAALAFDSAGNLFFADARTHTIRRIDALTGLLSTVAGNGTQGFSGDGGLALAAALDTPSGIAVDSTGALFLADSHNQRVRRIDPASHIISTVAGTGISGFAGDTAPAIAARLHLPRGLVIDPAGNLWLTDAANERIRRVDAVTGSIVTVAGGPVQRFAGDEGPAVSASLDTPRALALSPAGLLTLSDSANGRVRQVDSAAVIHTITGLGETSGASLTLAAPSVLTYGSGTLIATLSASPATGQVTLLDGVSAQPITLATVPLASNSASFSLAGLSAGTHLLRATYPGDAQHSAAQSGVFTLTVAPATLLATPNPASILYGQPIPALTGTLTGVLPADLSSVVLTLSSAATAQSSPAVYPITGALTGPASSNYNLTVAPASITIAKAPSVVTLATAGSYSAHVVSTTSGTPTGSVVLLDGSQTVASSPLVAGFASFTPTLSSGTHTLSAGYPGDPNFLSSSSPVSVVTIDPGPTPDFTLATSGQTAQTISAGSAASFVFSLNPINGGPPSSIQLTVLGLPQGATASFNPAYIPPGGAVTTTILTVQTLHAALMPPQTNPLQAVLAAMLPLLILSRRRKSLHRLMLSLLVAATLLSVSACGDRVSTSGQASPIKSYNVVVTGTATSASGAILQHIAAVTLNVQ